MKEIKELEEKLANSTKLLEETRAKNVRHAERLEASGNKLLNLTSMLASLPEQNVIPELRDTLNLIIGSLESDQAQFVAEQRETEAEIRKTELDIANIVEQIQKCKSSNAQYTAFFKLATEPTGAQHEVPDCDM